MQGRWARARAAVLSGRAAERSAWPSRRFCRAGAGRWTTPNLSMTKWGGRRFHAIAESSGDSCARLCPAHREEAAASITIVVQAA